jgi:hypothetical protein
LGAEKKILIVDDEQTTPPVISCLLQKDNNKLSLWIVLVREHPSGASPADDRDVRQQPAFCKAGRRINHYAAKGMGA